MITKVRKLIMFFSWSLHIIVSFFLTSSFRFSPLCVCLPVCVCVCVLFIQYVCAGLCLHSYLFCAGLCKHVCMCLCLHVDMCVFVCVCVCCLSPDRAVSSVWAYEEASWDSYAFVIYWSEFLLAEWLSEQSFTFVLPPCVFLLLPPLSLPLSLSSHWARRTRAEVRKHLHLCANLFHKVLLCALRCSPQHSHTHYQCFFGWCCILIFFISYHQHFSVRGQSFQQAAIDFSQPFAISCYEHIKQMQWIGPVI